MPSFRFSPFLWLLALILTASLLGFATVMAEPPQDSAASKPGNLSAPISTPVEAGYARTSWMSVSEMNAYLESLDGDKPGGKNFWDRGHWIDEVEGRWEAGIPEYRLSHSAVPACRNHWWFWYLNQDRESFDKLVHQLADDGFTLVSFNSYVRPGGSERFQGVWHKLIPLTNEPLLPAGHYQLSEIHKRTSIQWPVSLVIEGDRISGAGPRTEFSGSVKSRSSGSIKTTPIFPDSRHGPFQSVNFENEFLKLLEYATWKEDGHNLRVVKNGETVLRFKRDDPDGVEAAPKQ